MTVIAQVSPSTSIVREKDEYIAREREQALRHAPPRELDEFAFRAFLANYPLATIRLAAIRYSAARARTMGAACDNLVAALANPHINHGDSYRTAAGHVEATHQWRRTWDPKFREVGS